MPGRKKDNKDELFKCDVPTSSTDFQRQMFGVRVLLTWPASDSTRIDRYERRIGWENEPGGVNSVTEEAVARVAGADHVSHHRAGMKAYTYSQSAPVRVNVSAPARTYNDHNYPSKISNPLEGGEPSCV